MSHVQEEQQFLPPLKVEGQLEKGIFGRLSACETS